MFELHGIPAVITDAAQLEWRAEALRLDGAPIDLGYNRLTDFYLERPEHAALRSAYLARAAVLTPHPRAHALYADKRNLALLSDADLLRGWPLAEAARAALLGGIARTWLVSAASSEWLWRERKRLFFKPASGFGSRGAYRGAKLTRKTFAEILAGGYVAQEFVPPSERAARDAAGDRALRL
ncbi:MAG TPA: hypothetical protein VEC18_03010, partial [Myxococcota bacterium]|nr:hypothetical protein [Myxococcota bacterium]